MGPLTAICAAAAVLCVAICFAPSTPQSHQHRKSLWTREVARREAQLRNARLHFDAQRFTLLCFASPPLLFVTVLVLTSPVVAVGAAGASFFLPRMYLDTLERAQRRRTEAEAPRMLQTMLASLTAGRTYLEAIEEARQRVNDRWLKEDLEHLIRDFHLDVPLEESIADVRQRTTGRNLGLVWDNLAICIANRIPASKAKGLFMELAATVQFNVQVQQEVKARTSGQRAQIWMLAAIVPGLFLYLRLINPEFFAVLDDTVLGRFLLLPGACALEVLGLVLSFRIARVEV